MTASPHATRAIVRRVSPAFDDCIKPPESPQPIDLDLARNQHRAYCEALRDLDIELIELDADERHPDCVFVEDTAVVAGDTAVISRFGAGARRGEERAVVPVLEQDRRIVVVEPPATIEGGDVMKIGSTLYVGLTERTSLEGAEQLRAAVASAGFTVVPVPTTGVFHLKSAITYLGDGHIALSRGHFDESIFKQYTPVVIPTEEASATNCLAVNGTVFVSAGFPETSKRIGDAGFTVRELQTSEFRKAGGSLTCLSILL